MRDKPNDSSVINVKVTVEQTGSTYTAKYNPPVIPVKDNDAIIRFHLDEKTPADIVIDTVIITPLGQTQLGNPEISTNGKKVDVTDKNTIKETFHLNFTYKDKHSISPHVAALKCENGGPVDQYPQIENDPPG